MSKRASKIARILVMAIAVIVLACAISFTNVQVSRPSAASNARYSSDYSSKEESIVAGAELNERIAAEGAVLLKNNNGALPLSPGGVGSDAAGVTLFGYNSIAPETGASVNDTDASAGVTIATSDIYGSLQDSGFRTNPAVRAAYTDWMSASESNTSDYAALAGANAQTDPFGINKFTSDVAYSFGDYGDAAIVVLSATKAASADGGRTMTDKNSGAKHAHSLDKVQQELVKYAVAQKTEGVFDKVIVIINDSTPLELEDLDANAGVDAILLIGNPGASGLNVVGPLLSGAINPSGKLADIYPVDFTEDPTYNNFGRNSIEPTATVAGGNQYVDEEGNPLYAYFTDYEEGIYVGYRYYETMATELDETGDDWYEQNVTYPFGYGMSYTTFDWEVQNAAELTGAITEANVNKPITVSVKVTNSGDAAGKDVVELYYTAPYTDTATLEKSSVVLGDFAKTDLIAAKGSDSDTVTLKIKPSDMASYDVAANGGKGAWVLEAGDYVLSLRTDSHTVKAGESMEFTFNVAADIEITESDQTGEEIHNAFDDLAGLGAKETAEKHPGAKGFEELSRDDFASNANNSKQPQRRSLYNYDADGEALTTVNANANNVLDTSEGEFDDWDVTIALTTDSDDDGICDYDDTGSGTQPWYVAADDMPTYADAATRPATAEIMLSDMIGKSYDDPMWQSLVEQLTLDELTQMFMYGGFKSNAIPYIGKPETLDTDSPLGWSGNGTAGALFTRFATAPVIAATWNKELAFEMGKMMGDQGLWGRSDTGTAVKAYTGWYGPGMNTHRSPFLSRYTEYYSEDGYLAGMMAANASLGAAEKGCYVFIKHFAVHEDGGTDRGIFMGSEGSMTSGLSIWVSEQAIREIYLKPFQLAVEIGKAGAAMSSFSRIGTEWCGGSYGLLTQCLRNEWGFDGFVNTDIAIYDFLVAEQMLRAGNDITLDAAVYGMQLPEHCVLTVEEVAGDATMVAGLQKMAHNVLYTVANSNAMDVPHGAAVVYTGSTLEKATVGESYRAVVTTATLNTVYDYGALVSYSLYSGNVPEGMTFSNGMLSGTPTAAGTYSFTVAAQATNFETAYATFTVVVESNAATDAITGATDDINTKVDGAVSDLNGRIDATDEKVDGVNSMVTVALVFAIIAAVGAIASVVLVIIKKK